MRARHLVYHIQCFSCAICNQVLNKGDQFGIRSSAVFCRWVFICCHCDWNFHYFILLNRLHFDIDPAAPSPYSCSYTPSNVFCDSPNPSSPSDLTNIDGSSGSSGFYGSQHLNSSAANTNSITGLPQQPRQKGRPRKRKPKDIEAMTANLGEFQSYLLHSARLFWSFFLTSLAFTRFLFKEFAFKYLFIFFCKTMRQWATKCCWLFTNFPPRLFYMRILIYFLWEHFFALKSQFSYERILSMWRVSERSRKTKVMFSAYWDKK